MVAIRTARLLTIIESNITRIPRRLHLYLQLVSDASVAVDYRHLRSRRVMAIGVNATVEHLTALIVRRSGGHHL